MPPCFGSVEMAGCPDSKAENTKAVTNQRIDQSTQLLPKCSRRHHEAPTGNASTVVSACSPCRIALAAALPVLASCAMLQTPCRAFDRAQPGLVGGFRDGHPLHTVHSGVCCRMHRR